jgi:hypothetical protein
MPFLQKRPIDWDGFYHDMENDPVNPACLALTQSLMSSGYAPLLVTGRIGTEKITTLRWLIKSFPNNGIAWVAYSHEWLYMRKAGDKSSPADFKKKIYEEQIKDKFDVVLAVDDLLTVCRMWSSIGVPCLKYGTTDEVIEGSICLDDSQGSK